MNAARWLRTGAAAVALGLGAAACNYQGLYDVSLPGAAATSGDVVTVRAEFTDVLDLVPDSSVRINGVTVGSVKSVDLVRLADQRYVALVAMRIPAADAKLLPYNAEAVLSQTSLLGEKYIALQPDPNVAATGTLVNNELLCPGANRSVSSGPVTVDCTDSTSEDATVEQVFGALSALLNGGGVEQIQAIAQELTQTLHGREGYVRDLLRQLDVLVGNLNSQRGNIVAALDGLARFSGELASQRQVLATSLTDLGPGIQVLADQRGEIVSLLQALARLGTIGSQVIEASEQNTAVDLDTLRPILSSLADSGANLPHSLELGVDFPFPAEATAAIPGDYTKLSILVDLASFENLSNPVSTTPLKLPSNPLTGTKGTKTPLSGLGGTVSGLGGTVGKTLKNLTGTVPPVGGSSSSQGLGALLNGIL